MRKTREERRKKKEFCRWKGLPVYYNYAAIRTVNERSTGTRRSQGRAETGLLERENGISRVGEK